MNAYWSYTPIQNIHVIGTALPFSCRADFRDKYGRFFPAVDYSAAYVAYHNGCPINSQPAGAACACDANYTPDPAGTTCVSACPDHAHGTPCVCDDGYIFDAAGTTCILEQYTLSLSGLGGVVMPTKTRAAHAQVNTGTGSPKSGIQVNLKLEVVPEEDGYNHAVGQHTAPHQGSLSVPGGATGTDGRLSFAFQAPEAGGTHTITATCTNCTNQATGTITVPGCPVKELTEIKKLSELAGETQEQTQLTQKLEDGMDGYSLLTTATKVAEQCLAGRVNTVVGPPSVSKYQVTSTVRTVAYQKHLREVWDKFWDLRGRVTDDPSIQERCRTLITKVEGQMEFRLIQDPTGASEKCTAPGRAHCIRSGPAQTDPKHTQNIAFDIQMKMVKKFQNRLIPPSTVVYS